MIGWSDHQRAFRTGLDPVCESAIAFASLAHARFTVTEIMTDQISLAGEGVCDA